MISFRVFSCLPRHSKTDNHPTYLNLQKQPTILGNDEKFVNALIITPYLQYDIQSLKLVIKSQFYFLNSYARNSY